MKHTRHSARGFTLVELMVSLVAGLMVTIAVVGLARAATTTFFEAARISSVESAVRTASERLRQDLARASYMSTGNITLARDQALGVPMAHRIAVANPGATTGSRFAGLNGLQGIRIVVNGSGSAPIAGAGPGTSTLTAANNLNPDALMVSGNFTTDDSYQGTLGAGPSSCGGDIITLNAAADAAVRRLTNTGNPLASAQAAFTPVPGHLFGARVIDGRGCQHYGVVCAVNMVGANVVINFQGAAAIPPGPHSCGADPNEPVTVSPVQTVRWYLAQDTDPALQPASGGVEPPNNKLNLYRDMMNAAPAPAPIAQTRQIVAEYAIDLKFGITVNNYANALQVFEMDADPTNITAWTRDVGAGMLQGTPAPHRVRSVRFRLATRAGVPDRRVANVFPGDAPFLTRYCVTGQPIANCTDFARVRTIVSEVTLMNQLGMTY